MNHVSTLRCENCRALPTVNGAFNELPPDQAQAGAQTQEPQPVTDAGNSKSPTKADRRAEAEGWLREYKEVLPVQAGLVRRLVAIGDYPAAIEQATSLMRCYVLTLRTFATGRKQVDRPITVCIGDLARCETIPQKQLVELLTAWHQLTEAAKQNPHDPNNAPRAIQAASFAVMSLIRCCIDPARHGKKLSRSIKRRTNAAVDAFHRREMIDELPAETGATLPTATPPDFLVGFGPETTK